MKKYRGIELSRASAVQIPSKTLEKLQKAKSNAKKVISLAGAGLVVVTCFAACSGAQRVRNDISNQTKQEVIIPNYAKPFIKIPTTKEDVTSTPNESEEEIPSYINAKYEELLEMLNKKLETTNFPKIAKEFFQESLYRIYSNYEGYQKVYKDLPSVQEFIYKNLIKVIDNINEIEMIDIDSERGKALLENGAALAFTDEDFNITLIYKDPKLADEEQHSEDIKRIIHECAHCEMPQVFNPEFFDDDENTRYWWTEAEATFCSEFVNPLTTRKTAMWSIANTNGDKIIEYGKSDGIGYLVDLYAFENSAYLAGYNVAKGVGHDKKISAVREAIAKKYGEQTSQGIWDALAKWYSSYSENWKSDKTYNLAVDLQNKILECIKQDIQNLDINNKEQIKKFMDVYRNYKLKIMPQVFDEGHNLCTNQVFNIDDLDELLINKIVESGAMKFSSNNRINRMALKCMLFANNEMYTGEGIRMTYLPSNITDTEYNFMEYDIDGHHEGYMIMKYKGQEDEFGRICFIFDENNIINISLNDSTKELQNSETER